MLVRDRTGTRGSLSEIQALIFREGLVETGDNCSEHLETGRRFVTRGPVSDPLGPELLSGQA